MALRLVNHSSFLLTRQHPFLPSFLSSFLPSFLHHTVVSLVRLKPTASAHAHLNWHFYVFMLGTLRWSVISKVFCFLLFVLFCFCLILFGGPVTGANLPATKLTLVVVGGGRRSTRVVVDAVFVVVAVCLFVCLFCLICFVLFVCLFCLFFVVFLEGCFFFSR